MSDERSDGKRVVRLKARTIGAKEADAAFGRSSSAQRHEPKWSGRLGTRDLVEPPVDPVALSDLLLESTDFSTVVGQIASDVAGLGFHFTETKEGEAAPRDQIRRDRDRVETFFEEAPGGEDGDETLRDVLMRMLMDWETTGNGFLEIARNEGVPDGIFHLQSTRTRVRKDKDGFAQIGNGPRDLVWFRKFGSDPETGLGSEGDEETEGVEPWPIRGKDDGESFNEVVHFLHYHPASFWYGVSRIVPAVAAVRGNTFVAERNIKFFLNKALPEIMLVLEGNTESAKDEDMDQFVQHLTDHFMTEMMGEHFKPLLVEIPQGITMRVERLSPETKDSDHRMFRVDNRDEILRAFSMMPNRVGIIESGNLGGGTGESQIEIYKHSVVKPRQETIERRMNRLIREGLKVRTLAFKFDEIDTVDESREATIAGILGSLAWMTINEGRRYVSKFMKIELPEIDEAWAELPFPILAPQLAFLPLGVNGIQPAGEDDEPPHAGFGLPGMMNPAEMMAAKAYQRFFSRFGATGS